jgi:hypothetical protein
VSVGFSVCDALKLCVVAADDVGATMGSAIALVESTAELDGGGGVSEDTMLSSKDEADDGAATEELDGGGGVSEDTMLSNREEEDGEAAADELCATNVEETSRVEVSVLVVSASLVTTTLSDVEEIAEESELLWNSDSTNDEKSIWRDESCSEELLGDELEDEDEDDGVGAAGVVAFVTICRFTCLGK